jgi:hypothetical protein
MRSLPPFQKPSHSGTFGAEGPERSRPPSLSSGPVDSTHPELRFVRQGGCPMQISAPNEAGADRVRGDAVPGPRPSGRRWYGRGVSGRTPSPGKAVRNQGFCIRCSRRSRGSLGSRCRGPEPRSRFAFEPVPPDLDRRVFLALAKTPAEQFESEDEFEELSDQVRGQRAGSRSRKKQR